MYADPGPLNWPDVLKRIDHVLIKATLDARILAVIDYGLNTLSKQALPNNFELHRGSQKITHRASCLMTRLIPFEKGTGGRFC